jgi:hypothetical protein
MSEPRGGAPATPLPSKLPGVLVLVGAAAVLVGTLGLPWVVGYVTRGLSGESALYASLAFLGVSVVGGVLGFRMLAPGSNARLAAAVAILLALFAGSIIVLGYEAYSRRVERMASVGWNVAVGPAPYVAGVGAIVWVVGGLVGFVRRRPTEWWIGL